MARLRLRSQTEGQTGEGPKKTKAEYQAEFEAKLNAMPEEEVGEPSQDRYDSGFEEAQEGVKEAERFGLVKHLSRSRLAELKKNLIRQYRAGRYGNVSPEDFTNKVNDAKLILNEPVGNSQRKPLSMKPDKLPAIDPRIEALKRQMALQGKK